MSKLSYLLAVTLLLSACSTARVKEEAKPDAAATVVDEKTAEVAKEQAADMVQVDKENNAIKVTPHEESIHDQPKKKLKPLFDWPVWEARMTRGFFLTTNRKRRRPHKGIDLAATRGSAVMASHDGYVIYTGATFKGYGKMIMIESDKGPDGSTWATIYGHLDKILVYEGKRVRQHEVIGALGNTGRSSGPHLHFEIRRINNLGQTNILDPLPLLPAGEALTNDVDNGIIEE